MDIHVLNGDALRQKFPLPGKIAICREALIDGPSSASSTDQFFELRAAFISDTFHVSVEEYFTQVKNEFDKLKEADSDDSIHLWFEFDLFCQANLWFTLHFIRSIGLSCKLFLVSPDQTSSNIWSGFGCMNGEALKQRYQHRIEITQNDLAFADKLWSAYSRNDFVSLEELSETPSNVFPLLKDVIEAHIARFPKSGLGRPQRRLKSILDAGIRDFSTIFKEFSATEGIYGFGDAQVESILDRMRY